MSIFSSYKKIFLLGFILVILVAIPFSVYLAQQRQNISSKAAKATTLSFDPASTTVKVGDPVNLNIVLDPGTNQVSFAKLFIKFDASKFTVTSLTPNTVENALQQKIDEAQLDNGTAKISLSIGADPTLAIKTKTTIATLQLKAIAATTSTGSSVTFDTTSDNTQVLSIANADGASENVLLSAAASATVTITSATQSPTSAITSAPIQTSTTTPLTSPSSSAAPVCSSLDVNGLTSGTAPYSLTFTATGNASSGTITKISFNFGDSVKDLTVGGGIGTSSVSGQLLHTYNTPGIYTAYAILTDSNNNLSVQQAGCTKTITISNPTTIVQPLPPTGDGRIMLGLGTAGVIFTIIGGVLLILL